MTSLIKIKKFSELVGLSVRTLQYYDEIELLIPEEIDLNGHRYYGEQSFITAFMINSLKQIGMNLVDIKSYLQKKDFSMNHFIEKEKRRVENEISDLQFKLIMLENIEGFKNSTLLENPTFISMMSYGEIEQESVFEIARKLPPQINFSIAETTQFMSNLDFCRVNDLMSDHPLVKSCLGYWNTLLSSLGDDQEAITKAAEKKYQRENKSYGMTTENYHYLSKILEQDRYL